MCLAICALSAPSIVRANPCAPPPSAASLLPVLQVRADAVVRLPPGSGVDVRLEPKPCGGFHVRAEDGASAADMAWARAVTDADSLAVALGAKPFAMPLSVQNYPGHVGITADGAPPVAGNDPARVLTRFFRARLKDSYTLPLDTISLIADAPEDWPGLMTHLRIETESSITFATGDRVTVPLRDVVTGAGPLFVQTVQPGLNGKVATAPNGASQITLSRDQKVPHGTYPVYLYRGDSRFEPAARLDVTVVESKPN